MNKEFIPYEEALAMKELGFDEFTVAAYVDNELDVGGLWKDSVKSKVIHKAPLFQQAFRWFRDKYNLVFNFISYSIVKPGEYHWSITWNDEAKAGGIVKTYEEAELACLKKLIEIVNQNKEDEKR